MGGEKRGSVVENWGNRRWEVGKYCKILLDKKVSWNF